jgi:hypothetical protein
LAAFAYDLEAARPDARDRARERLNQLVRTFGQARERAAAADAETRRRASLVPQRPLQAYAGEYAADWYGEIRFTEEGESTRDSRRLLPVRGWSHDKTDPVFS